MMKKNRQNLGLGELEAEIMEELWRLKSASVRRILAELRKKRKIAYTTVMTVMSRLSDKGILKRKLDENNAYVYRPVQDKEAFSAAVSKTVISNLIKEYGEVAVAQFIDVIGRNNRKEVRELLEKLKKVK